MKTNSPAHRLLLAVGMATLLAFVPQGVAAGYIKFDGIDGEFMAGRFAGWSEMIGSGTSTTPAALAGVAPTISFSITKAVDRASPKLFLRCASGAAIPRVTLLWEGERGIAYRVRCADVRITGVDLDGSGGSLPLESISFNFQKIEWSAITLDPDGTDGGALIADFDLNTLTPELKARLPFRADFAPGDREGFRIICPVTRGHRYRILASAGLKNEWQIVSDFTAEQDGTVQQFIPTNPARLFLKLEEVD